ncbi:hypothetical protein JL720_6250 [Aureococcus anophagefferens]|nr:hypothetical protein JL720_6250 [Aureococcus anophagefferens]
MVSSSDAVDAAVPGGTRDGAGDGRPEVAWAAAAVADRAACDDVPLIRAWAARCAVRQPREPPSRASLDEADVAEYDDVAELGAQRRSSSGAAEDAPARSLALPNLRLGRLSPQGEGLRTFQSSRARSAPLDHSAAGRQRRATHRSARSARLSTADGSTHRGRAERLPPVGARRRSDAKLAPSGKAPTTPRPSTTTRSGDCVDAFRFCDAVPWLWSSGPPDCSRSLAASSREPSTPVALEPLAASFEAGDGVLRVPALRLSPAGPAPPDGVDDLWCLDVPVGAESSRPATDRSGAGLSLDAASARRMTRSLSIGGGDEPTPSLSCITGGAPSPSPRTPGDPPRVRRAAAAPATRRRARQRRRRAPPALDDDELHELVVTLLLVLAVGRSSEGELEPAFCTAHPLSDTGTGIRSHPDRRLSASALRSLNESPMTPTGLRPEHRRSHGALTGRSQSLTARSLSAATRITRAHGTEAVAAPEVLLGVQQSGTGQAAPVGPPADVWALGCLLYELVAGRKLFEDAVASDWPLFFVTLSNEAAPLPHEAALEPLTHLACKPALLDLLQTALRRDPARHRGQLAANAPRRRPAPRPPAGAAGPPRRLSSV